MRKINTRNYRLATRATPREVNRRIVLNLIREHQPISRAELARRMNVRRAALTEIVRDLLGANDVYETGPAAAVRGRRPTMLRVRTSGRLAVAVDVRPGRTSIALAEFGGDGVAARGVRHAEPNPTTSRCRSPRTSAAILADRPSDVAERRALPRHRDRRARNGRSTLGTDPLRTAVGLARRSAPQRGDGSA